MLKKFKVFLFVAFTLSAFLCNNIFAATAIVKIKVNDLGIDIYTPVVGADYGYYYGPSIIINPDKSIDIWASSLPDGVGWDSIRWIHSNDGGKTWTKPVVALKPTAQKEDNFSTCDPGVIKFGGYYYIGYTSTLVEDGTPNNVYVARSTSPSGPFEKWNGSGWGGDPRALTNFTGDTAYGGGSMPCFIVKDNKIYMYYTYQAGETDNGQRLSIGDATNPNWPATLKDQGYVKVKDGLVSPSDIKYCDKYGKFIGIVVNDMYKWNATIQVFESADGINFKDTNIITYEDNIMPYNHNAGISGTPDGHLDLNVQNFIGYAYTQNGGDEKWGYWATRFAPVTITNEVETTSSSSSSSVSSSKPSSSSSATHSSSNSSSGTPVSSSNSNTISDLSSLISSEVTGIGNSSAAESIEKPEGSNVVILIISIIGALILISATVLLYLFYIKKKS